MDPFFRKLVDLGRSNTVKAFIIGFLSLLLLIPGNMIQNLILERQQRSDDAINKINLKWSNAQTVKGPVLRLPFTRLVKDSKGKVINESHVLTITPARLKVNTLLSPEERHYGIYKSILYKSDIQLQGEFMKPDLAGFTDCRFDWSAATVFIGVDDLRGVTNNIDFELDKKHYPAEVGGASHNVLGQGLTMKVGSVELNDANAVSFSCNLHLNGSGSINFIPLGKETKVEIRGNWSSPGFVGNFTPNNYKIDSSGFTASWNILHFNRNIPDDWVDNSVSSPNDASFGVSLVETVDQYQQNMRSAKYSFLFIVLTFVVFFLFEVLTKKKIHPVQYLLVGFALLLFYSLLLSLSEQIGFGMSYLIASVAIVGLITTYVRSILKNNKQTVILLAVLTALYVFLYVVLQLEDMALLIGSVGLFLILAVIMYVSKKINWYSSEPEEND